jgi:mevalonate kinase
MVTGEHAVVYGKKSIVAAIDQRLTVTLRARRDRNLEIHSHIADPQITPLDALSLKGPYRFVMACVSHVKDRLRTGLSINISSEIDPTLGLGSSAAVTVALLAGLRHWVGQGGHDLGDLHVDACAIVRNIQGRGSGADLAASLMGGMVGYQIGSPAWITPLPSPPALSLCYAGYKTPTSEVLALIADRMALDPDKYKELYRRMGLLSEHAIDSAQTRDWAAFADSLSAFQVCMAELGVSDRVLDRLVTDAAAHHCVLGAKISGSGLGDCVLALGSVPEGFTPVYLAKEGVRIDD